MKEAQCKLACNCVSFVMTSRRLPRSQPLREAAGSRFMLRDNCHTILWYNFTQNARITIEFDA